MPRGWNWVDVVKHVRMYYVVWLFNCKWYLNSSQRLDQPTLHSYFLLQCKFYQCARDTIIPRVIGCVFRAL